MRFHLATAIAIFAITAPLLAGQSVSASQTDEEIRLLRQEVQELRTEVDSLREELHGQTASAQPSSGTAPEAQQQDSAATQTVLQSQIEQLAQTKVESASKWPVKIYGTILSTTFFNSHTLDWADLPTIVNANSNVFPASSLSSSLRQSRIGLLVDGPTVGPFRTSGVFAMDFTGGMTDFGATPLFGLANIVYAYARLETPKTAIEAGQDEMILAPRNPASLVAYAYPELYQAGNLYARTPQIRIERSLAGSSEGRQLKLVVGLVAPVSTYPNLDYPGGNIMNGWLRPAAQGRLSWRSSAPDSNATSGWELGLSGHYGRADFPLADKSGNIVSSFSAASYAGALDFDAHYRRFGIGGEGYMGQNLQSLGGGIGQQGKTMGGYLEARLHATQRLQLNGGIGDDHLIRSDRIPALLNRNSAIFANSILNLTPEIGVSLEYRYMITRPFDGTILRNNNIDLGIAYKF